MAKGTRARRQRRVLLSLFEMGGHVSKSATNRINHVYTNIDAYQSWIQGGLKAIKSFSAKHPLQVLRFEDVTERTIRDLLRYYPDIFSAKDSHKVTVNKLNDSFNALALDDVVLLNKELKGSALLGTIFHEALHVMRAHYDPKRLGDNAPDYEPSLMMQEELLCFLFEEAILHPTYPLHKLKAIAKERLLDAQYPYDPKDLDLWMHTFKPSESHASWQRGNRLNRGRPFKKVVASSTAK
jgi:hypothetical protein